MKHLLLLALISTSVLSCQKIETVQSVHAEFTNLQGFHLLDTYSGQTIRISSADFAHLTPNGPVPADARVLFDNKPVPVKSWGTGYITAEVPVMYLADYKSLTISVRLNTLRYNIIEKLFYRPTVHGEVFAGGPAATGTFQMPAEMTLDPSGNLYVIDQRMSNDVIIRVTPGGTAALFAGGANEFGRLTGIGINPAGTELYVSDATAQQVKKFPIASPSAVTVLAGSGTAGNTDGTGTAASFNFGSESVSNGSTNERGQGLTVDVSGNIYVAEKVGSSSSQTQIRRITPTGVVTTIAGSTVVPMSATDVSTIAGLTVTTSGELLYTGGASTMFQGISKVTAAGPVRLAGKVSFEGMNDGLGSVAEFSVPKAIHHLTNRFYIADGWNGALRRSDVSGNVITLAGVGHFKTPSFCLCGVFTPKDSSYIMPSQFLVNADKHELAAKAIMMDLVGGVAVRNHGLIYVSDYGPGFKCVWRIRIE